MKSIEMTGTRMIKAKTRRIGQSSRTEIALLSTMIVNISKMNLSSGFATRKISITIVTKSIVPILMIDIQNRTLPITDTLRN